MGVTIPSTLTTTDTETIQAVYGTDYDAIIAAIESGTLDSSIELEDAVAYVLAYSESAAWLDPANASLAYLWSDTETMAALEEIYRNELGDPDQALLVADIEAFQVAGGFDMSTLGVVEDWVADYEELYGELTAGSSGYGDTYVLENLSSALLAFPGLWLLAYMDQVFGPLTEDFMTEIDDQNVDIAEQIDDKIEIVKDADSEDAEDAAESQAAQLELQNLQELQKTLMEIFKTIYEMGITYIDTASSLAAQDRNLKQGINQRMG